MCFYRHKRKAPVWIENTHFLASSDFSCSVCGYKTGKPKQYCPNCGAGPLKIEYEDREMQEWLEENPGCDDIDFEIYMNCDIYDED